MPRERITDEFCTELGSGEADEMEETIDLIITVVITAVIDMHPEGQGKMRNLKTMLSVRMTLDEGVGYLGGQRLAHERPYLLVPALDTYANASWHAMRRSRFDRGEYRQGFMAGFQDELAGLAHPLPPEQPVAFAY
jgi:hypothetical protein